MDDGTLDTPSGVYIGNVNPGTVAAAYSRSLHNLHAFDAGNELGLLVGCIDVQSGAQISKARNDVVAKFLELCDDPEAPAEWLLFLDSDMDFPPDLLVRLQSAAKEAKADIIGGLCVMVTDMGAIPTIYQWDNVPGSTGFTRVSLDYPKNSLVQVAATGTACLMINKGILKRMRETYGNDYGWFSEMVVTTEGEPHWVSEDIAFCARAGQHGARIFVDTTTKIGHAKNGRVWTADDVDARTGQGAPKIVAVIPMKDRHDLTSNLVNQLLTARVDMIYVIDNGSADPESVAWLDGVRGLPRVSVAEMPDAGIHEMWNAGATMARTRFGERAHIAFLNNDIDVSADFLPLLSFAMTEHPEYMVVGGNYDGRPMNVPVIEVNDICADRYDGTGGLPGFAFMVRGELFAGGYSFPEECKWWYGDNDLMMSLAHTRAVNPHFADGYRAGIVTYAHCRHIGAGTAKDWTSPEYAEQIRADESAFLRRWSRPDRAEEANS